MKQNNLRNPKSNFGVFIRSKELEPISKEIGIVLLSYFLFTLLLMTTAGHRFSSPLNSPFWYLLRETIEGTIIICFPPCLAVYFTKMRIYKYVTFPLIGGIWGALIEFIKINTANPGLRPHALGLTAGSFFYAAIVCLVAVVVGAGLFRMATRDGEPKA